MASSGDGAKLPEPSVEPPSTTSSAAAARKCESCRSAPGIPFCCVEWSFLCSGCASGVHGHNWIVSVPPNAAHNPNLPHFPYFPYPYPHFASPNSDPNVAAHHSSDEDDISTARWHASGMPAAYRRLECVMRYREKRRSRRFAKTVRYENRRAYAEVRPRMDGRFSGREEGNDPGMEGEGRVRYVGIDQVSELKAVAGGELRGAAAGGEELGQPDFTEDVRLQ